MAWGFEFGRIYNRRADIHGRFRGQQQGGIITPADQSFPIIIITGEAGSAYGYCDRRRADGVFEYFGEGQVGDMTLTAGNKWINAHAENGRDLLLFSKAKDGLRFQGQYVCEGFHIERAPDTGGNERNAIVFELRPIEALILAEDPTAAAVSDGGLAVLRQRAMEAAKVVPAKTVTISTVFERDRIIRSYVLKRSKGNCEDCGHAAPFLTANGAPFLEVHHIRRLTDGGPDDPRFMIALCPNCHRRAHHGIDAKDRNIRMLTFVTQIEKQ